MKNNILLVGSQHGNELLGIRLHEYITQKDPTLLPYIEYYCANPLAFALNKRYIQTDMNRSYALGGDGYEGRRAELLSELITSNNYTYIIDCHTTTTEVGACFIFGKRNTTVDRVINAAPHITNGILMENDIAQSSLLRVRDDIVALEINEVLAVEQSTLDMLLDMLKHLVEDTRRHPTPRTIYRVDGFIEPTEIIIGELHNFKRYCGRYPVLCGGDTKNRTYRGFWSSKQPKVLI